MKVLGDITPEFANGEYLGGVIVMLTECETNLLRALQGAWDDEDFMFPARANPKDINMEKQFQAVHAYIEARFAMNEFKSAIYSLEDYLVKSDEL